MVDIQEVIDNENMEDVSIPPSQERLLDAEEIEKVAATLTRPTARMQLESLAKKLRKEAAALKVVEATNTTNNSNSQDAMEVETTPTPSPSVTTPAAASSPAPAPVPVPVVVSPSSASASSSSVKYTTIDRFSFDAGGYNEKFVTLYISLPGVGQVPKEQVSCRFEKDCVDLIVKDLKNSSGQLISYRLYKDNLEHDIVPDKSKYIIKADKVVIKLAKVKSEYGSFDYWSKLTDPKRKEKNLKASKNPAASINELMKEMYENGDDQMRKMIGETMLKQQRGELGKDPLGGGAGGLGDFDDDI